MKVSLTDHFINQKLDIIETTNAKELSYKLGHNDLSILSHEEFKKKFNLDQNEKIFAARKRERERESEGKEYYNFTIERDGYSSNYKDWVQEGYVNPIEDQGYCGGCWAFGAVGALESLEAIKYGKSNLKVYSKQQAISCDGYNSGCEGGLPVNAWKWLSEMDDQWYPKMCTASVYPYTMSDSECADPWWDWWPYPCIYSRSIPDEWDDYVGVNQDSALLQYTDESPTVVSINADTIQFYSSGIYSDASCSNQLNHVVINVGYGTDNGVDYWKVRNSWGTGWGEDGYIRMKRFGNPYDGPYLGICGILGDINIVEI